MGVLICACLCRHMPGRPPRRAAGWASVLAGTTTESTALCTSHEQITVFNTVSTRQYCGAVQGQSLYPSCLMHPGWAAQKELWWCWLADSCAWSDISVLQKASMLTEDTSFLGKQDILGAMLGCSRLLPTSLNLQLGGEDSPSHYNFKTCRSGPEQGCVGVRSSSKRGMPVMPVNSIMPLYCQSPHAYKFPEIPERHCHEWGYLPWRGFHKERSQGV